MELLEYIAEKEQEKNLIEAKAPDSRLVDQIIAEVEGESLSCEDTLSERDEPEES